MDATDRRSRSLLLKLAVLGVGAALACGAAAADWKPERAIEIIVPTGPGGANDNTARTIQRVFQQERIVAVPINVLNKVGGGGAISLNYLNQHAGDGHYLLNASINVLTNHITGLSKLHYTDFTPVAMLFNEYVAFAVGADSALKSGRDMIERLKADPASLNFAIGTARGGTNHSAVALVARAAGVDVRRLKTVVFQSNSQAATAAMGGHVDVAPISGSAAVTAAKSGKLRIIGVTSPQRLSGALADVPTWKEQGADVDFSNSRYMLGPRGMTQAQLAYWDQAFARLAQSGPWKKDLEDNNWSSNTLGSAETARYLATLYDALKVVLTDAGLVK